MRDDHAHVMQVNLCTANTRGVTTGRLGAAAMVVQISGQTHRGQNTRPQSSADAARSMIGALMQ